jgi:DNA-binding transcriptional regulator GbsR (MarR family)
MLLFFSKLFKKPKTKVINNNPTVNVTVVETPKPEKKLSVEEIVDALDGVHSANDDVYTNVALLVCEIKDVYDSESVEKRNAQKEEVFKTLKAIEEQIRNM